MPEITLKLGPRPSPLEIAKLNEWEDDYVRQLCPELCSHERANFKPVGLSLQPKSKTSASVKRKLKAEGWEWDRSGLAWINTSLWIKYDNARY